LSEVDEGERKKGENERGGVEKESKKKIRNSYRCRARKKQKYLGGSNNHSGGLILMGSRTRPEKEHGFCPC